MQLGSKSIVKRIIVCNKYIQGDRWTVLVQTNKNYGICNIQVEGFPTINLGRILSNFQGQQINDENVIGELGYELSNLLNSVE